MTKLFVTVDNIAYKNLIMDDKDYVALVQLMSRAVVVDEVYVKTGDDHARYYVVCSPATVGATTKIPTTISLAT